MRQQNAVIVTSAGGLENSDYNREHDRWGSSSLPPVKYQGAEAARAQPECDNLGLGEVQYMVTRLRADMLQSGCCQLAMVTDIPEYWQAGRMYLQSSEPLNM